MNILAVCTGNTCRSPMVMALIKKLHPEHNVLSAGIFANEEPISQNSVLALKQEGIDLSDYISVQLTPQMLEEADVVVCATKEHEMLIKAFLKDQKVFVLDCPDPFGGNLETYIATKDYLIEKIKELSFD